MERPGTACASSPALPAALPRLLAAQLNSSLEEVARAAKPGGARRALAVRTMKVMVRLVAGLEAAGICMGDLKLENVLMLPCGMPVVADFGLARCLRDEQGGSSPRPLLGATPYMVPPEVAQGQVLVGSGYDVWCLGIMLLELLLGPREGYKLVRRAATYGWRAACGLYVCHVEVGKLQRLCIEAAGWQQDLLVEILGAAAFSSMLLEEPKQRFSGARLARLPLFGTLPTWGELGELARLLPGPAASS